MKNPERLIGKKVRGFKFESNQNVGYSKLLDNQIGKVGVIKKIYDDNTVRVLFEGIINFFYPVDQIEAHLVEDEIPTLSDGVMMLVGNSLHKLKPRKVLFKKNGLHYAFVSDAEVIVLGYQFCKPLDPTKEEQLTAILGSSEKVSEIMELFKK